MSEIIPILAILASMTVGWYLFQEYSSGANATYDAIATLSSALWVLAGIFAIMGGFVLAGSIAIIIFSYIGLTKGSLTKQRLRSRIAG